MKNEKFYQYVPNGSKSQSVGRGWDGVGESEKNGIFRKIFQNGTKSQSMVGVGKVVRGK